MPRKWKIRASSKCLNESPSEKEGKYVQHREPVVALSRLNESPSEKEGKY